MTHGTNDSSNSYETMSRLVVSNVRGVSRLTTCLNVAPLKILQPDTHGAACHVVLGNYGGGFVQGDDVSLAITCEENSRFCLTTQANTRAYRVDENRETRQIVTGTVAPDAIAVVLPDPVVPHKDSRFVQLQTWDVAPNGALLLTDCFASGRSDAGEHFAYQLYRSEIEVRFGGKRVLLDRLESEPGRRPPARPGRFGTYHMAMNLYLVGPTFAPLAETLTRLATNKETRIGAAARSAAPLLATCNGIQPGVWILRILADHRRSLMPILQAVGDAVALSSCLGFSPIRDLQPPTPGQCG